MRISRIFLGIQLAPVLLSLVGGGAFAAEPQDAPPKDFTKLDLSGEWYVLIHYKDSKSEDKSITKFKDFAWSIKQGESRIAWEKYPYVLFNEELEGVRRHAMTQHLAWEPDRATWAGIRQAIDVSSRAMTRKRLSGSVEAGFSSQAPLGGGLNTLTFSRVWRVSFERSRVRVEIVESLSGTETLAGMEEATVFEIEEQVAPDELRGRWREGSKGGTFRMVRARERRVVK